MKKEITLEAWKKRFNELTTDFFKRVELTKFYNEDEIAQVIDELQNEAYCDLNNGESPDYICDWNFYDESCEVRQDLILEKQEAFREI